MATVTKKGAEKKEGAALSAPVYSAAGKEVRKIDLPATLFDAPRNMALVRQVVVAIDANARTPVAHTKDRGDVRGGGRKPWKQKGTGRARHGSIRSPIWRGGGTTFGPRNERDFSQKVNRNMRARALATALSEKFRTGKVVFVDALSFETPKTKEAKEALVSVAKGAGQEALGTRRNNAALIALSSNDANAKKSFANMGNVAVVESRNLNASDVLAYRYIVIVNPEASIEALPTVKK